MELATLQRLLFQGISLDVVDFAFVVVVVYNFFYVWSRVFVSENDHFSRSLTVVGVEALV